MTERPASTIDAFHRGGFWLVQPKTGAHRAGMDAMILAASVPQDFSGRLADFGAGAGAAGLAVACRCSQARVTLVENAPAMLDFARLTLGYPGNAAIAQRVEVLDADVSLAGARRAASGLADNGFDFVIMNPPFNDDRDRQPDAALKQAAYVMPAGLIEAWVRSAAAIVKPKGGFAAILRPQSMGAVLAAISGRFGGARIVPIHPRADAPAIRIVVRAERGSRKGLSLERPLVLHEAAGNHFSAEADALINGNTSLFGD